MSVRATDDYLGLTNEKGGDTAEGAKMRVVVVVEDLGSVGPNTSVNVRPGYKQHSAGVYVADETDMSMLDLDNSGTASGMIQNPLDRIPNTNGNGSGQNGGPPALTPMEKKKLEMLTVEWEGWRKNAGQYSVQFSLLLLLLLPNFYFEF